MTSDKWLVLAAGIYLLVLAALAAEQSVLLLAAVVLGGGIAGIEHVTRRH